MPKATPAFMAPPTSSPFLDQSASANWSDGMFGGLDGSASGSKDGSVAVPTPEENEQLDLNVKRGENILKLGLVQLNLGKANGSSSLVREHVASLSLKLRELDERLCTARKTLNFQSLEGDWLESFPEALALFTDIIQRCELETKLLKTLFASLKGAGNAGAK